MKKHEEIGSAAQVVDYLAQLTPKQAKAVPLLATGATATEVAKIINVSPGQLSAWKKDAVFMRALAETRRGTLREVEHELISLAREAVKTVQELMTGSTNEQVRLRAAAIVFERVDAWAARDGDPVTMEDGHSLRDVLSALIGDR